MNRKPCSRMTSNSPIIAAAKMEVEIQSTDRFGPKYFTLTTQVITATSPQVNEVINLVLALRTMRTAAVARTEYKRLT